MVSLWSGILFSHKNNEEPMDGSSNSMDEHDSTILIKKSDKKAIRYMIPFILADCWLSGLGKMGEWGMVT